MGVLAEGFLRIALVSRAPASQPCPKDGRDTAVVTIPPSPTSGPPQRPHQCSVPQGNLGALSPTTTAKP